MTWNHEILHDKIGLNSLFKTFFRSILSFLEAEIHRFIIVGLAWKTLYYWSKPILFKNQGGRRGWQYRNDQNFEKCGRAPRRAHFHYQTKYINTVKYFVHFFKQIIVFHSLLHARMVWLKFACFFLLPLFICKAVVQILCLDSNLDSRKKILDSIWIVLANDLDSCNFHKVATLCSSGHSAWQRQV